MAQGAGDRDGARHRLARSAQGVPAAPVDQGTDEPDHDLEDLRPVLAAILPDGWDGPIGSHDRVVLDTALRRVWQLVYNRAWSRARDRGEAEEVAQEVFCRVLARMGAWPVDDVLRRAYLLRAAQNLQHDEWSRQRRREVADTVYAADRSGLPVPPEDEVLRRLDAEALQVALRALPPLQAQVIRLRIGEGLSAEETAAVVGKSAPAVRQIQHRAVLRLRAQLHSPATGDGR